MSVILIWGIVFVVSLTTLIIAADFFIKASEKIGVALGVPSFIIGVTVVALGTSLPELISSIIAVTADASDIVLGNVIGSNIANICLVLGMIGIIGGRVKLNFEIVEVELPIMIGATFFLGLSIYDQHFSGFEALLAFSGIGIYLGYILHLGNKERRMVKEKGIKPKLKPKLGWKQPVILLVGAIAIYLSADYNVKSIIKIAKELNIGAELVAQTAVALGTSLPELVVSLAAVRNRNTEMAIGNILGSNIFNIFAVTSIPSLFGKIVVPESILSFSVPMLVIASVLCYFMLQEKVVNRWGGLLLLLFYIYFIGNLAGF